MIRFLKYVREFWSLISRPYLVAPDDADGVAFNEAAR